MQKLSADVMKLLKDLPPGELEKIKTSLSGDGAIIPKSKKPKVIIEEVLHQYYCEFCEAVKEKTYPVKVTNGEQGVRSFVKPVILYHVCDKCKEIIIRGLAYALMMRGGESNALKASY